VSTRWIIATTDPAPVDCGLPRPLAQVLANRGLRDPAEIRAFLQPQLRQLRDPFELPDMAKAVDRIRAAVSKQERVVIYGDYDVDGVTSSALLTRVLRLAGATVANFLPQRLEEGYGLSADGIARCLQEHQPQLVIAVDCGTSSVAEIAGLKLQGVDVIVLDHHEPPPEHPACVALVNPKIATALTPLASVGVAFKLAHALVKTSSELRDRLDLREQLDLAAVGTVADLVPLTGENRILVKAGLERLAATTNVGLRALLDITGVRGDASTVDVGFRLGPRLNAAGRLTDAMTALELLLTTDATRAQALAKLLHEQNAERQQIQEHLCAAALAQAHEQELDRVLVLANDAWHPGVIGIVASRVVQEFYRPTVVIGTGGKGSCRSISGFSMVAALRASAPALEKFGGHEMAAGLTVKPGQIAELRRLLNEHAAGVLREEDLARRIVVDAVVRIDELNDEFFAGLAQFEPCGMDNPAPCFAVERVRLRGEPRVVGKNHLRFSVTDGTSTAGAIWWNKGDYELPRGEFDMACQPEENEFRGETTLQLKVRDVREKK